MINWSFAHLNSIFSFPQFLQFTPSCHLSKSPAKWPSHMAEQLCPSFRCKLTRQKHGHDLPQTTSSRPLRRAASKYIHRDFHWRRKTSATLWATPNDICISLSAPLVTGMRVRKNTLKPWWKCRAHWRPQGRQRKGQGFWLWLWFFLVFWWPGPFALT